ncbi:DsrE family protein [Rheinheimera sp.]|uniref:DsrE/DsrF/TusD sulfur relay family protein n=1 Tax=Rheinheimera sp. TaxID=1869214 RepID=UPI00307EA8CD
MIAVLLQSAVLQGQGFASALRFLEHCVAQGKQVDSVFLYRDAVWAASAAIDLPSDEPDLAALLRQCCAQQQIPLLYCVTAAEKRGVTAVAEPCIAAGLAEFAMRLSQVKQLVQF